MLTSCYNVVYAYYHFSGAKKVVEKITASKERYDNVKEAAAEKGEVAREKLETLKDAAKVKAASLRDRWATRGSRNKGDGVRIVSNSLAVLELTSR